MTNIEIIEYFTNHHRFNGEVIVSGAGEIIAKTINRDTFFDFAFFDEISRNIERDYTVNVKSDRTLDFIIKM